MIAAKDQWQRVLVQRLEARVVQAPAHRLDLPDVLLLVVDGVLGLGYRRRQVALVDGQVVDEEHHREHIVSSEDGVGVREDLG